MELKAETGCLTPWRQTLERGVLEPFIDKALALALAPTPALAPAETMNLLQPLSLQ